MYSEKPNKISRMSFLQKQVSTLEIGGFLPKTCGNDKPKQISVSNNGLMKNPTASGLRAAGLLATALRPKRYSGVFSINIVVDKLPYTKRV
jgi:hypothetical protein